MAKTLLRGWLHSLRGAWAGGHFHLTAGLVLLVLVLIAAAFAAHRMRPVPEPGTTVVQEGGGVVAVVIAAAAVASIWLLMHRRTPASVAARPVVTHTTIVQHVAASHPMLSGWQIVAIAMAALVVLVILRLNNR